MLAVAVEGPFSMALALITDPRTEPVAIAGIALRDADVTVVCDVVQESPETLLPLVGEGVPCPAGQVFESTLATGLKGAFGVFAALHTDPLTELVAIARVGLRDAGVTVAFDVGQ